VDQIEGHHGRENQFFITLASDDKSATDSLMLFNFSRPQNLIMFWKFQIPIQRIFFSKQHINEKARNSLMIVNKAEELQQLYCGVKK
jgi:CRISPR/Cas system Type II protein with McrA/HNH and RuvC-like nuclease domain